jgi:hypothetical protein
MRVTYALSPLLPAFAILLLLLALVRKPATQPVSGATLNGTASWPRLEPVGNLPGNPIHVAVQGNYAYLIDIAKQVTVVDIQNPSQPITLAVGAYRDDCYTPPHCFPWFPAAGRLVVSGTTLYVPLFDLRLVDIADPAAPVEASRALNFSQIHAAVVHGSYIYASAPQTLYVADVSEAYSPTTVISISVPGVGGYAMALLEERLFVARSDALIVLDVSDPVGPAIIDSHPIEDVGVVALAGANGNLYAGAGEVLHVLDVANAAEISETARYTMSAPIRDLELAGSHLFVVTAEGVHALDVSNPAYPVELAAYSGLVSYSAVADGGYLYVADQQSGLNVFRLVTDPLFLPMIQR